MKTLAYPSPPLKCHELYEWLLSVIQQSQTCKLKFRNFSNRSKERTYFNVSCIFYWLTSHQQQSVTSTCGSTTNDVTPTTISHFDLWVNNKWRHTNNNQSLRLVGQQQMTSYQQQSVTSTCGSTANDVIIT